MQSKRLQVTSTVTVTRKYRRDGCSHACCTSACRRWRSFPLCSRHTGTCTVCVGDAIGCPCFSSPLNFMGRKETGPTLVLPRRKSGPSRVDSVYQESAHPSVIPLALHRALHGADRYRRCDARSQTATTHGGQHMSCSASGRQCSRDSRDVH